MKKFIKALLVAIAVCAIATVCVSAANVTVTYSLEPYDADAKQYDVYVNVNMGEVACVNTFTTRFTFNQSKMILTDTDYNPVDIATATDEPVNPAETKVGKKTYSYSLANPGVGNWWVNKGGSMYQSYITAYTLDGAQFDATDLDIYTISFVLAAGVEPKDITSDDFTVDYIYIRDTNLGAFSHNFSAYNTVADTTTPVTVVNNVPAAVVSDSKITVPAGSTVYFADGTNGKYAEETEVTVPKAAGYMVVNTGYTAQKLYTVAADGTYTAVSALENALLGINAASIRTTGYQGIRFISSIANSAIALTTAEDGREIAEYGFIITAESTKNALGDDYELNFALVESGKAKKGVAYNKAEGKQISFKVNSDTTEFTNVITNIPKTSVALLTTLASRPYYILDDGTVIYGEITKKSVFEVAMAIKQAAGDDYTNNKEYIDEVISIVNAPKTSEIVIDVSQLYS